MCYPYNGFSLQPRFNSSNYISISAKTLPLTINNAYPTSPFYITIHGNTVNGAGVGNFIREGLYAIPIVVSGKNIINSSRLISSSSVFNSYITINSDGSATIKNPTGKYLEFTIPNMKLEAGTYALSCKNISDFRTKICLQSGPSQSFINYTSRSVTQQFTSECMASVRICLAPYVTEKLTLQLEQNTYASSYEKYYEQEIFNIFSTKPLYSNEEYIQFVPVCNKAWYNPGNLDGVV